MKKELKLPVNLLKSFREEFISFDNHDIIWSFLYKKKQQVFTHKDFANILLHLINNFTWLRFHRVSIGNINDGIWTINHNKTCIEWLSNLLETEQSVPLPDTLSGVQAIYNFEHDYLVNLNHIRDNVYLEVSLEDGEFSVDIYLEDFPFYKQGATFFSDDDFPQEMVEHNRNILAQSFDELNKSTYFKLYECYTENKSGHYTINKSGIKNL